MNGPFSEFWHLNGQTFLTPMYMPIFARIPMGGSPRGGTLIFSAYVGSDLASTVHPKKISGISSTPKKYLKFYQPKKISKFCTLTLEKDPKLHRNDPQTSPILWWSQKNIHKIFIPPKNIHFSENQKKYWNSEFWTPKNRPSLRMCENIRVPPPPPGVAAVCLAKKVWTRTRPNLVSGQARFQSVCFDRILYSNTANSRPKGHGFEPHRRHCVVSLSKTH